MKLSMPELPPSILLAALGSYNLLPAIVFLPTRRRCDEAASEAAFSRRPESDTRREARRNSQTSALGHDRSGRDRLASRGTHAGLETGN